MPGGGNHDGILFGRIEIGSDRVSRRQQSQLQEVAPVQWQVVDLVGVDYAVHNRRDRIHFLNAEVVDNDQGLLCLNTKRDFQFLLLPHFQGNRGGEVGKAGRLHPNLVSSRRQVVEHEYALMVRGRTSADSGGVLPRAYGHALDHRTLRINNRALEHSGA